jgi:transcriptional regulator with XRE-family HTH domain
MRFDAEKFSLALDFALNGRSLRQVATESGVSQATISRVLRNIGTPDVETFLALCDWMRCSPIDFVRLSFVPEHADVESAALRARIGRVREQLEAILEDL